MHFATFVHEVFQVRRAQAPASACTAAQPHPPPGLPPTLLPETVEDPKRALVHALQNDLSRMSVLLGRLDELLSA